MVMVTGQAGGDEGGTNTRNGVKAAAALYHLAFVARRSVLIGVVVPDPEWPLGVGAV